MSPRLLACLALLSGVLLSAALRVQVAVDDEAFDPADAAGMLRSDPALLVHLTERIVDAGGGVPEDWRADARIQHPDLTDVPAEFTVGEEFLVAWAHLATGRRFPLHMVATVLMSLIASLSLVGAFGLARAATGRRRAGLLAAALFLLVPANYRTIGFVLMREDLALPLFALHLAGLAAALRRPAPWRFALAGLLLAGALGTWHAMGFLVLAELVALAAALLFLEEPPELPGAGWALLPPALAGLLVPALAASGLLLSLPALLAVGLFAALRVGGGRGRRSLACLAPPALGLVAARLLAPGPGAYRHVTDVLRAKLRHGGLLPADPSAMSFDARLLWQGPFATLAPSELWPLLGFALAAVPLAALLLARRPGAPGRTALDRGLVLFLALSLVAAWLVRRLLLLPGLLAPVVIAVAGERLGERGFPRARAAAWGLVVLQLFPFGGFVAGHVIDWYRPPVRQAELSDLVRWVGDHVPADEAVVSDFVTSTAILQGAGRAIVLQPKYETDASRRKAEAFLGALFHGPPEGLRALCRERFRARWLVVDRHVLLADSAYLAGLAPGERPDPASAVARLASSAEEVLAGVPGFELVYRTPRRLAGVPTTDRYRVFRLGD